MALESAELKPRSGLGRALRHRNYRLFFGGQGVSLIGTWITRIATSWLIFRLTGSELLLGLNGFCSQIPLLILSPFTGVLVDRWDRHRTLVVTQFLSLLQSGLLAWLALTHRITVVDILVLQLFQGVVNAFDTPARQTFVSEMVDDPRDLPNAIALNSSMFNASRIIGPSAGGLMIAAVGEGWCFLVDAISYVAVILSLWAMRFVRAKAQRDPSGVFEDLRIGWRYVSGFMPVRTLLLQLAIIGVVGTPFTALMPAMAAQVLGGGPHTLGFLMTAQGVGALMGALYMASRTSILGLGRLIIKATTLFAVGLAAFSLSRNVALSVILLFFTNMGFMLLMASTNTIIQTLVDGKLRGRVLAYYAMAMLGTTPLGSLLGGALAERYGAPRTILAGAGACLLTTGWFALQRTKMTAHIRPIYLERGILAAAESA